MEAKKTKRANLENKRWMFFQAGMIISLALVLLAFNYKSSMSENSDFITKTRLEDVLEEIVITRMDEPKVTTPPPSPVDITKLIAVNDDGIDTDIDLGGLEELWGDTEIKYNYYEPTEVDTEFFLVEEMPKFHGGEKEAFWADVQSRLRYPSLAVINNIEGKVYARFVVDRNGSVTSIQIVRSVDPLLDEEVKRVLAGSDRWEPGKQRGKEVKVAYIMPFTFALSR